MSAASDPRRARRGRVALTLATAAALTTGGAAGAGAPVAAATAADGAILRYTFDDLVTEGGQVPEEAVVTDSAGGHDGFVFSSGATVVPGPSGRAGDLALSLPGGASTSAAPHVIIPPGLVAADATDITLSAWLNWSGAPTCTWPYGLGADVNRYVFATTRCGANAYGAVKNGTTEIRAAAAAPAPTGTWVHVAVVVDGGTSITTYVNGVRVGSTATTLTAAAAAGTATYSGYLGKSFYPADAYWSGAIDDFLVLGTALPDADVAALGAPVYEHLAGVDAAVSLGDTSAVTADLTLPSSGANASAISWASSAPGVVATTGKVVRPAAGAPDAVVQLTPTATFGTRSVAGAPITVTVKALPQPVPLAVTATTRCVGATAYVAVQATNAAGAPATITLTTPYGGRTVADVAPGRQAYQSFNTRAGQVVAGTVTVTATATIGGTPVTSTYQVAYEGRTCP
ncbi:LamG domain-containing protein [Dactylosporangium sp. AC04546]|uniref:LamG domain-containing protein n=1 Tax=Dactylosporangium sp. AC04546 TaxID=2862460 RepID=UPI001EE14390|nr:LamG domain-containing protein [Dactylosporangium sp. AC04546]WVK86310.1 LamG domain-containing protein [Dactylosporangium sp. AC04546]